MIYNLLSNSRRDFSRLTLTTRLPIGFGYFSFVTPQYPHYPQVCWASATVATHAFFSNVRRHHRWDIDGSLGTSFRRYILLPSAATSLSPVLNWADHNTRLLTVQFTFLCFRDAAAHILPYTHIYIHVYYYADNLA